jgi:DNA polymerase-3 subunit gamma/tau
MAKENDRAPLSLYRHYRPQKFSEVRGQEHVTGPLEAAVKNKKIAHAYLFAGGRGTGKTSMARIVAKALGTSDEDVYEMDAASNRGIDEVRALREGVATLPFNSTYKFYIIDEAHALTRDAWGALLKTLEEPPEHVIFVLCTTELEKVPETIQSRCQVFNFKKPTHAILKSLVVDVSKKEGARLSSAAAELVAMMGEGSFRDTLGTLQRVLTTVGAGAVIDEQVAQVLGAPSSQSVNQFLSALAAKNIEDALAVFHRAVAGGVEARVFVLLAMAKLRAVLLLRFAPKLKTELEEQFGADDLKVLEHLAGKAGAALNAELLAQLISAQLDMARAPLPALPLELALYRALGA